MDLNMTNGKSLVVHCKKEYYDIYIGRGSKWGNPFSHKNGTKAKHIVETREKAIEEYKKWILEQDDLMQDLWQLKGKILGCYCKPKACHGDILAELANKEE